MPILYCADISEDVNGAVNVTVKWKLSHRDSADFHLINITTNASQVPYGGHLEINTTSITEYELTGFLAGYEYNITICSVIAEQDDLKWSEPLTIIPKGKHVCCVDCLVTCLLEGAFI